MWLREGKHIYLSIFINILFIEAHSINLSNIDFKLVSDEFSSY